MTYIKPTCDCGEDLLFYRAIKKMTSHKINKSGKLHFKAKTDDSKDEFYLKCETCGHSYVAYFKYMDNKRVYKGDLVSSDTYFSDNKQWFSDFE